MDTRDPDVLTGSAMKSMVGRMTDPAITSRSSRARDLNPDKEGGYDRHLSGEGLSDSELRPSYLQSVALGGMT